MSALTIPAFDAEVLETSLKPVEQLPGMRDAVHAETALVHSIPAMASSDRALDLVRGLARIDPTARRAVPPAPSTNGASQP